MKSVSILPLLRGPRNPAEDNDRNYLVSPHTPKITSPPKDNYSKKTPTPDDGSTSSSSSVSSSSSPPFFLFTGQKSKSERIMKSKSLLSPNTLPKLIHTTTNNHPPSKGVSSSSSSSSSKDTSSYFSASSSSSSSSYSPVSSTPFSSASSPRGTPCISSTVSYPRTASDNDYSEYLLTLSYHCVINNWSAVLSLVPYTLSNPQQTLHSPHQQYQYQETSPPSSSYRIHPLTTQTKSSSTSSILSRTNARYRQQLRTNDNAALSFFSSTWKNNDSFDNAEDTITGDSSPVIRMSPSLSFGTPFRLLMHTLDNSRLNHPQCRQIISFYYQQQYSTTKSNRNNDILPYRSDDYNYRYSNPNPKEDPVERSLRMVNTTTNINTTKLLIDSPGENSTHSPLSPTHTNVSPSSVCRTVSASLYQTPVTQPSRSSTILSPSLSVIPMGQQSSLSSNTVNTINSYHPVGGGSSNNSNPVITPIITSSSLTRPLTPLTITSTTAYTMVTTNVSPNIILQPLLVGTDGSQQHTSSSSSSSNNYYNGTVTTDLKSTVITLAHLEAASRSTSPNFIDDNKNHHHNQSPTPSLLHVISRPSTAESLSSVSTSKNTDDKDDDDGTRSTGVSTITDEEPLEMNVTTTTNTSVTPLSKSNSVELLRDTRSNENDNHHYNDIPLLPIYPVVSSSSVIRHYPSYSSSFIPTVSSPQRIIVSRKNGTGSNDNRKSTGEKIFL